MIIEPDDARPWAQIAFPLATEYLIKKGVPADDADWVGPSVLDLLNPDGLEYSVTERNELNGFCTDALVTVAELYVTDADRERNTWLMLLIAAVLSHARLHLQVMSGGSIKCQELRKNPESLAERLLELCRGKGLDASRAFAQLAAGRNRPLVLGFQPDKLAAWFFVRGAVDIRRIICRDAVPSEDLDISWKAEIAVGQYTCLRTLRFWSDAIGPDALHEIVPWIAESTDSELLTFVPMLRKVASISAKPDLNPSSPQSRLLEFRRRISQILNDRCSALPEDSELKYLWWVYSVLGWAGNVDACPFRDALVSSATEYWGKLRPLIRVEMIIQKGARAIAEKGATWPRSIAPRRGCSTCRVH